MQTAVWYQHINYIKVVVESRNFYSLLHYQREGKKIQFWISCVVV